jgi:pyridoxamine 5'-phosphate oxidase
MRLTPLASQGMPAAGALAFLVDDVWKRIADSLDGRWPPWALPTLATSSAQGPRARILALRAADAAARTFVFHADARSDKVREIAADARVSVVFWDPADGIEARFNGTALLHREDGLARTAWQTVSPLRRLASRSVDSPGTHLMQPARFDALPVRPGEDALDNFAVLRVVVAQLDWLWVGAEDMRRASFAWTGTQWAGVWVVP